MAERRTTTSLIGGVRDIAGPNAGRARCGVVLLAALTACTGGCMKSTVANQGQNHDVTAVFRMGELYAELPGEVGVLTAQSAAAATLRSRGYVITDSAGTKDRAYVTAKSYVDGRTEKTRVDVSSEAKGTMVHIESGTFGDETASRDLLDGILKRLGR